MTCFCLCLDIGRVSLLVDPEKYSAIKPVHQHQKSLHLSLSFLPLTSRGHCWAISKDYTQCVLTMWHLIVSLSSLTLTRFSFMFVLFICFVCMFSQQMVRKMENNSEFVWFLWWRWSGFLNCGIIFKKRRTPDAVTTKMKFFFELFSKSELQHWVLCVKGQL